MQNFEPLNKFDDGLKKSFQEWDLPAHENLWKKINETLTNIEEIKADYGLTEVEKNSENNQLDEVWTRLNESLNLIEHTKTDSIINNDYQNWNPEFQTETTWANIKESVILHKKRVELFDYLYQRSIKSFTRYYFLLFFILLPYLLMNENIFQKIPISKNELKNETHDNKTGSEFLMTKNKKLKFSTQNRNTFSDKVAPISPLLSNKNDTLLKDYIDKIDKLAFLPFEDYPSLFEVNLSLNKKLTKKNSITTHFTFSSIYSIISSKRTKEMNVGGLGFSAGVLVKKQYNKNAVIYTEISYNYSKTNDYSFHEGAYTKGNFTMSYLQTAVGFQHKNRLSAPLSFELSMAKPLDILKERSSKITEIHSTKPMLYGMALGFEKPLSPHLKYKLSYHILSPLSFTKTNVLFLQSFKIGIIF